MPLMPQVFIILWIDALPYSRQKYLHNKKIKTSGKKEDCTFLFNPVIIFLEIMNVQKTVSRCPFFPVGDTLRAAGCLLKYIISSSLSHSDVFNGGRCDSNLFLWVT